MFGMSHRSTTYQVSSKFAQWFWGKIFFKGFYKNNIFFIRKFREQSKYIVHTGCKADDLSGTFFVFLRLLFFAFLLPYVT